MSQEDIDLIKTELRQDLGRGYFKMSQNKIIVLIGCTISVCLTVFGGIIYIDRNLTSHSIRLEQHEAAINGIRNVEMSELRKDVKANTSDIQLIKWDINLLNHGTNRNP